MWRIIAFIVHQQRTTKSPRDGLHYQQQVILRNAATPGVASWQLTLLIPPWRKLSRRPFWGSIALIATSVVNLLGFFAAGILVAEVTRTTGTEVLVRGKNCGIWVPNATDSVTGFATETLNDSRRTRLRSRVLRWPYKLITVQSVSDPKSPLFKKKQCHMPLY